MVVLDTCAWLWMCSESTKLSRAAREAITREQRHDGLVVSIISAWEIAKLVQKAKLSFSIPCSEWIEGAVRADGVTMHPLTPEICVESTELPGVFHGDPADQLIVATARLLEGRRSEMLCARCHPGDTCDHRPDHRTGDQIPEHSWRAAAGRRERDDRDGEHRDHAAQRSAQKPPSWPGGDADEKADQQPRAVECPHRHRAPDAEHVELVWDRSMHQRGEPAEHEPEERAQERVGEAAHGCFEPPPLRDSGSHVERKRATWSEARRLASGNGAHGPAVS